MDKILLVDGSNLLFQMFYGMPARIVGKSGQPVHGTLGFLGALLKVIRMREPTHVLVLFDGEHENPRTQLDASYKSNRPDFSEVAKEEAPFSQLPDICRCLEYLHLACLETEDCEADDLIASYAIACGNTMQVEIVSHDSDLFQLIAPNVSVLRYRGKLTQCYDEAVLVEKLGVQPQQYAEFKALTGDTSDNIPGVPHVGPKTAAKLLCEFGTLENLMANLERVHGSSLREALLENKERIRKNKALIRLDGSVPCPISVDSLAYIPVEKSSVQILRELDIL